MTEETKSNTPSKERNLFVHEPEGDGFTYFSDEKERDEFAESLIGEYLQDGWNEGVESIITGTLTHTVEKTNVRHKKDQKLDDDGCDEDGNYWDDGWDYICNYELTSLDT